MKKILMNELLPFEKIVVFNKEERKVEEVHKIFDDYEFKKNKTSRLYSKKLSIKDIYNNLK
jgi:hypothetical protein